MSELHTLLSAMKKERYTTPGNAGIIIERTVESAKVEGLWLDAPIEVDK